MARHRRRLMDETGYKISEDDERCTVFKGAGTTWRSTTRCVYTMSTFGQTILSLATDGINTTTRIAAAKRTPNALRGCLTMTRAPTCRLLQMVGSPVVLWGMTAHGVTTRTAQRRKSGVRQTSRTALADADSQKQRCFGEKALHNSRRDIGHVAGHKRAWTITMLQQRQP